MSSDANVKPSEVANNDIDKGVENTSKGWKVGDPINKLTSKGQYPSWNTVKRRYWKNEAEITQVNIQQKTLIG